MALRSAGQADRKAMYRIKQPTTPLLIIKHYPLIQKCIGLVFVVGGLCVSYFVFPNLVVLRCDRSQNKCSLEQSSLIRSRVSQIPLQDVRAAKLETIYPDHSQNISEISYRIWINTRRGSIPFTPYSIGSLATDQAKIVSRINSYLEDPNVSSLEVVQDERFLFYLLSAGLICFGLLPLSFARTITCRLDKAENTFFMKGGGLWGFRKVRRPLSDFVGASVQTVKEGGSPMCRVVFECDSGEKIPLTYYRYYGSEGPQMIVKEVNDFLASR
jgi:hypothetical protein